MTTPHADAFVRRHGWTLLAVALAGLDLSGHLFTGWVPHDEGVLALSGVLVRAGHWPHRDFVDVYSGGMALLSAAAQFLFGDDLRALRYPFFAATLGWVALMAAVLRRFVSAPAAAALALLAFLWGPPLYTAPLPSWYLLFTATAALWMVLRWTETADRRWLFATGVAIGVALLLKINGLFLLAGVGSFLLADRAAPAAAPARGGPLLRLVGLGLGAGGIVVVVMAGWPAAQALPLLIPIIALAGSGGMARWADPESWSDLRRTLGPALLALGAGISVVVAPFLLAYLVTGAGGALLTGVLVLPFRRVASARMLAPALRPTELLLVGGMFLACHRALPAWASRGLASLVLAAGAWAAVRGNGDDRLVILTAWQVARVLLPGGLLLAAWTAARRHEGTRPLLAAAYVTAWFACIQYPFAAPVYFAYVAPLVVIVLAGLAAVHRVTPAMPFALALGMGMVTLGINHGQTINALGFRHRPVVNVPLDLPRGGLEIPIAEAVNYEDVAATIDRWGARRILAAPDSPEVYYLTGRPMVGREFFEFTAPVWDAAELVRRAREAEVEVVVLKHGAQFSRLPLDEVRSAFGPTVVTDTVLGRFRLLRLRPLHASP